MMGITTFIIRSTSHTVWLACGLSQNCGVVLNARARRTAISAPTELRPAMSLKGLVARSH